MSAIAIGAKVEDLAVEYLQNHNLIILQRNFSCRYGEIDIIAQQSDCIIFVEVRYRKYNAFWKRCRKRNF
jgi:Predicted endonuclease distantly related to archaeal Holliday junction resolvase